MPPGQRAGRPVALSRHGHERPDAVRRLFLDRLVVFGLRRPRQRGHGTAVAGHRFGVDVGQRHVLDERPGTAAVPRQQQPQPRVQRVRVATPLVQRASRLHRPALVVCNIVTPSTCVGQMDYRNRHNDNNNENGRKSNGLCTTKRTEMFVYMRLTKNK